MQSGNTNYGYRSLQYNTKGSHNSAFGAYSSQRTDSSWNTSIGAYANTSNISGISNIAIGTNSLLLNSQGSYNTAIGTASLLNNKSNSNTSIGSNSMQLTTTGSVNIAVGVQSGYNNTTGSKNVFLGSDAGLKNTIGSENVFLGYNSGGYNSGSEFTDNNRNTFLGANTKNTYGHSNATVIGYDADILISNGITLGTMDDKVLIPGTGYINTIDDPGQEIATQSYVQHVITTGSTLVPPCACATTGNIILDPGTTDIVIDGYIVQEGDAVLVKSQNAPQNSSNQNTSDSSNGIYIYNLTTGYTRASYSAIDSSIVGQATFIRNGNLNKGILFQQSIDSTQVGIDYLMYNELAQINFSVGNGLEIVGNQLNVKSNLTDSNGNPFLNNVGIEKLNISKNLTMTGSDSYIQLSTSKNTSYITDINTFGGKILLCNASNQISMNGSTQLLTSISFNSVGIIKNATYLVVGKYVMINDSSIEQSYTYASFDLSSNTISGAIPTNDEYLVRLNKQIVINGGKHTVPFSFLIDSNNFSTNTMYISFQGESPSVGIWTQSCIMHATRLG
jgi:hypothetical protein